MLPRPATDLTDDELHAVAEAGTILWASAPEHIAQLVGPEAYAEYDQLQWEFMNCARLAKTNGDLFNRAWLCNRLRRLDAVLETTAAKLPARTRAFYYTAFGTLAAAVSKDSPTLWKTDG